MSASRIARLTAGAFTATAVTLGTLTPPAPTAVELAAFDVITPWLTVFNDTVDNVVRLINDVIYPPLPVAQQTLANQLLHLSELPDVTAIGAQVAANLAAGVTAPVSGDLFSMDIPHALGFAALQAAVAKLPDFTPVPGIVAPLLGFTGSFVSGALIGLIGPVLGPALALAQSVQSITAALTAPVPDVATALSEAINTVPNVLNAFLNGGPVLAATPLVSVIGSILGVSIPAVTTVGIAMGGVLSPGGSLFNTADLTIKIELPEPDPPLEFALNGVPSGTLGSLIGIPRSIARAIGWDGFGNPLRPGIPVPKAAVVKARGASDVVSRPGSRPSPAAAVAQTSHRVAAGSRAARR